MPVPSSAHPTPYPDVNAILTLLLAEVRAILGDRFVGMYLYGSLSSGDFDPGSSDVDFLVATEGELPDEALAALEAMHARIAASGLPWAWSRPSRLTPFRYCSVVALPSIVARTRLYGG